MNIRVKATDTSYIVIRTDLSVLDNVVNNNPDFNNFLKATIENDIKKAIDLRIREQKNFDHFKDAFGRFIHFSVDRNGDYCMDKNSEYIYYRVNLHLKRVIDENFNVIIDILTVEGYNIEHNEYCSNTGKFELKEYINNYTSHISDAEIVMIEYQKKIDLSELDEFFNDTDFTILEQFYDKNEVFNEIKQYIIDYINDDSLDFSKESNRKFAFRIGTDLSCHVKLHVKRSKSGSTGKILRDIITIHYLELQQDIYKGSETVAVGLELHEVDKYENKTYTYNSNNVYNDDSFQILIL